MKHGSALQAPPAAAAAVDAGAVEAFTRQRVMQALVELVARQRALAAAPHVDPAHVDDAQLREHAVTDLALCTPAEQRLLEVMAERLVGAGSSAAKAATRDTSEPAAVAAYAERPERVTLGVPVRWRDAPPTRDGRRGLPLGPSSRAGVIDVDHLMRALDCEDGGMDASRQELQYELAMVGALRDARRAADSGAAQAQDARAAALLQAVLDPSAPGSRGGGTGEDDAALAILRADVAHVAGAPPPSALAGLRLAVA